MMTRGRAQVDADPDVDESMFEEVPDPGEENGTQARPGVPSWRLTPNGHALDEAVSALQKAIRRGRALEAVYWGHEVWSKYPAYLWRRMLIIASEDCAADPQVAVTIGQLAWNAEFASKKFAKGQTSGIIEAQAILVAARAQKSKEALDAVGLIKEAKTKTFRIEPPEYALDLHTARGKRQGKGLDDFIAHGRIIAGSLGRNDFELARFGFRQQYEPEPGEQGRPPDLVIPDDKKAYLPK